MGTVFAHCLAAAQGAIVYFTAVLLSPLLLSSPLPSPPPPPPPLLPSSAPVPTGASIHNSSIALAADYVEDISTDSQTKCMKM